MNYEDFDMDKYAVIVKSHGSITEAYPKDVIKVMLYKTLLNDIEEALKESNELSYDQIEEILNKRFKVW